MSVVPILTALRLATLALGLVFLWFVAKAYTKYRAPSMLILLVAVLLLLGGVGAEGVAYRVLGLNLDHAHVVEAVFMLLAFAVLVASVLSHRNPERRVLAPSPEEPAYGRGDEAGMGGEAGRDDAEARGRRGT